MMNNGFQTFTYQMPTQDQSKFYYPNELEGEHRGLSFKKDQQYHLYYVVCPPGKTLPPQLAAAFTKITLLQKAIDDWHSENLRIALPNKEDQ